jgi:two-component system, LytTR family, response regulator
MPLTAIAIDDEPQALDIVRHHAAKIPFLDLKATFTDAFAGIAWLQTNRADLLFLDINMPDISGIDVINCLPRGISVIFTTAHADYAVQGFDLDAVDYLLKPFSPARFLKACTKAAEVHATRGGNLPDFVFVKTGYAEEKVLLNEILYVEAEGNYLAWVLANRKLLSRQTMSEVGVHFPPGQFVLRRD